LKEKLTTIDNKLLTQYTILNESEIKELITGEKWMATIENIVKNEMQRISLRLNRRIKEISERYETPMSDLLNKAKVCEEKVFDHLNKMGFVWNK